MGTIHLLRVQPSGSWLHENVLGSGGPGNLTDRRPVIFAAIGNRFVIRDKSTRTLSRCHLAQFVCVIDNFRPSAQRWLAPTPSTARANSVGLPEARQQATL